MSAPFWTNRSVLAFAGDADPMTSMAERARDLVLEALESGWSGPPFNPFELARLLEVDVVAREDLSDARLTESADGTPVIEYNPTRPRGRLRFSIAHELAHTFFPDYADFARYRKGVRDAPDEWQLELLCDVGAAELLMPIGSFAELAEEAPRIERLMELRRVYDVSTEALLLRVAKLTSEAITVFAASRLDGDRLESRFRVDYVVNSRRGWDAGVRRGDVIPASSQLGECTAVGYTAKGHLTLRGSTRVKVECVGVPPFPGQTLPRVVGIALPLQPETPGHELTEVFGDALDPRGEGHRVIVHMVNDRTPNWGGEFARALKARYPETQRDFRNWVKEDRRRLRLGSIRLLDLTESLAVATMVAQRGWRPTREDTPLVRYGVLRDCLAEIAEIALARKSSIHMPRIGTGGGGGDWRVIRELIDETLVQRGVPVTVYGLPETKPPVPAQQMLGLG